MSANLIERARDAASIAVNRELLLALANALTNTGAERDAAEDRAEEAERLWRQARWYMERASWDDPTAADLAATFMRNTARFYDPAPPVDVGAPDPKART